MQLMLVDEDSGPGKDLSRLTLVREEMIACEIVI